MPHRSARFALSCCVLLALLLAACGGGDNGSSDGADAATNDETPAAQVTDDQTPSDDAAAPANTETPGGPAIVVTTTDDDGDGSLRQAIQAANNLAGRATITFDPDLFADPVTIVLQSPLPELAADMTIDGYIDGRLWTATGVTVSGDDAVAVFRVAKDADVRIASLTIANGAAEAGAGVYNAGALVLEGVTLMDNAATGDGGAVLNDGGQLWLINSTVVRNTAGGRGGGLANVDGSAVVTHATFAENDAPTGAGLFNAATLRLSNSILANSLSGMDCLSEAGWDEASTQNIITSGEGCGTPFSTVAPGFQDLGLYNGPTMTLPVVSGGPAINMADNAASVGRNGERLVWDQRGNGDPRFVAGYADIGAFERQAFPDFVVDTTSDSVMRGCSSAPDDCSLRGAIELANVTPEPDTLTFDPRAFGEPQTITLDAALPEVTVNLTIDTTGVAQVRIDAAAVDGDALPVADGVALDTTGLRLP